METEHRILDKIVALEEKMNKCIEEEREITAHINILQCSFHSTFVLENFVVNEDGVCIEGGWSFYFDSENSEIGKIKDIEIEETSAQIMFGNDNLLVLDFESC